MPTPKTADWQSLVFRALSDPTRRMILDELSRRDNQSLFEMCGRLIEERQLSLTRQAITKHLKVLEAAGLVTVSWAGRTKLHSFNQKPLAKLGKAWLSPYLPQNSGNLVKKRKGKKP